MSKYRIVERKYSNGDISYICQKRFLWWWEVMIVPKEDVCLGAVFSTLEEAKSFLSKKVLTITEEKVEFEI